MDKIIFHIDVNNAFLSWSAIDLLNSGYKIDIRTIDAVIGGDESKRHGIVLAKSTSAKQKGIYTSESLYSARKKCHNLKIYSPNYEVYQTMSKKLFNLLSRYTPDIEIFSIDECFIDYTAIKHLYGDELTFAYNLKDQIKKELGFTVNIGIGNNKLCAKMASDFLKPDKVHTLYDNEIKEKMWPLPVGNLFGIGKKTSVKLKEIDINTIGDLANYDINKLSNYFKNQASKMIESANGIDESRVISNTRENKGMSNSTTLNHDLTTKEEVYEVLNDISENLGLLLRKQHKYAYVIAVNLKDRYFKSYSHQIKLKNATNITDEILEVAKKLFNEMWNMEPIRLVGMRVDNLVEEDTFQVSLFEDIEDRNRINKLEATVDKLKEKYGHNVIKKASLIENKEKNKH
jgi:DNA polymerase-4